MITIFGSLNICQFICLLSTQRLESSDRQRLRQQQSSRLAATQNGKEVEDEFADLAVGRRKLSIAQVMHYSIYFEQVVGCLTHCASAYFLLRSVTWC